jgi:CheY-like chemotaxis protein
MSWKTILIVEDDGLIALYLTELMEKAGYRVVGSVSTGEMVIRMLENYPKPDLILMDIGLAGSLDGIETARQVQQRFSVPVIFVTAYTSENMLERIREIAPEGYIGKPFLDNETLALIRKVLDQRAK